MFKIKSEMKTASAILQEAGRQLPFATALALTWTAQDVLKDHQAAILRNYDRPTRNTVNGLYVKPATKTNLSAYVGLKDYNVKGNPTSRYLRPTIEGAPREHKGFEKLLIAKGAMRRDEFAIPGSGEPLNSYGNISAGKIVKALANLGSLRDLYQNSTRGRVYFTGSPFKGAPRGLWVRERGRVRPFLIYSSGSPNYSQKYDFESVSQLSAKAHIENNAEKALEKVLKEARP